MKKYPYFILFILLLSAKTSSQQLTPYVVAPSGGFYTSSIGSLSFTTGELALIDTYHSPLAILTQGFQQEFDFGTSVAGPNDSGFAYSIYPNPSFGEFTLVTQSSSGAAIEAIVTDILGREIHRAHIDQEFDTMIHSLDLTTIASGTYLVRLIVKEHHENMQHQFVSRIQVIK